MSSYKELIGLFQKEDLNKAIYLGIIMLVMAIFDVIGIASILPFIAVLSDPNIVNENAYLSWVFESLGRFGISTIYEFLFVQGIAIFLILVTAVIIKSYGTYLQIKFVLLQEYRLGKRLIETYLSQPYSWFLSKNSTDLGKTILSEADNVVQRAIFPFVFLISQSVLAILILTMLVLVNPFVALSALIILAFSYMVIYMFVRGGILNLGVGRFEANRKRYIAVNEIFLSIKEIKVGRFEERFIETFKSPALTYANHQSIASAIGKIPRFILEAIAFGSMLLVILALMYNGDDFQSILPLLSLYALAGYRLMPALQQIYNSSVQIKYSQPSVKALREDLMQKTVSHKISSGALQTKFDNEIEFKNVGYQFENNTNYALKSISLKIERGKKIAFVGKSGSGKTTTSDILLGLLSPQKGSLYIDGKESKFEALKGLRDELGFVPQKYALIDDTVSANIAFGIDSDQINSDLLIESAKKALAYDFIMNELPNSFDTNIGDGGLRLSGGQKQRIAIARALYKNPNLLIMDEATSALDNITEASVMKSLSDLGEQLTVIFIAHRLSTIKNCDIIYLFDEGKIVASGTYDDLIRNSEHFKNIVKGNQD